MTDRAKLRARRAASVIEIEHAGVPMTISIGEYPDGGIGEVFVHMQAKHLSSSIEALARDAAILTSIAIQYGAPLDVLRAAVTRDTTTGGEHGLPSSMIGAVLDGMAKR